MKSNNRILVVDDEEDLCEILQLNLEGEGYIVDVAYSAEEALTKPLASYNLLILDVMLGEMSGFKLANKIKVKENISTPIIFLSAKSTENDKLTGFNVGADDYIPKPFSIKEVVARVKVVIKRTTRHIETKTEAKELNIGNLHINLDRKKVSLNGESIKFTKKEFEILVLLTQSEGRIFTRNEILTKIWDTDVIVVNRTVDVNIARIRKKIGKFGKSIKSRSGYGYCFDQS